MTVCEQHHAQHLGEAPELELSSVRCPLLPPSNDLQGCFRLRWCRGAQNSSKEHVASAPRTGAQPVPSRCPRTQIRARHARIETAERANKIVCC